MSNAASTPLYGAPRPKNKPIPLSSTSIHALSTELALARSAAASKSSSTAARPRPTKLPRTLHNAGVSSRAAKDVSTRPALDDVPEHDLERSRKKLKQKARLYKELQRGDGEEKDEGLVDFTRKWAEEGDGEGESSSEEDEGEEELVEYEDEFGRTRRGTKREAEREKRRREGGSAMGAEDSARPAPPSQVIYGNTIQTHAFQTPEFSTVPKAEELLAKLPEEKEEDVEAHYDASREVRTKGVGFYQFSKDSKVRREEMEELLKQREETEMRRREKEERRKRKREEIEKRKEEVKAKRRVKVGGSWLEDQFGGLESEGGGS
jgi:hypothetical protein